MTIERSMGANSVMWQSRVNPTTSGPVGGGFPHLVVGGETQTPSAQVEEARAFMTEVRGFGEAMRGFASEFLSATQSIFDSMVGTTSDTSALPVVVNNNDNSGGSFNVVGEGGNSGGGNSGYSVDVGVSQVAASQQNAGYSVNAGEVNSATPGRNDFTIERNGRNYDFSVTVSATTSNGSLQQRMADAINDQVAGVTADVQTNDYTGQSALVLTAVSTGEYNSFTIEDVPEQGSAVAATGVDTVVREAQDAVYTVNGEERTSPVNNVDIGGGLSAFIQDVTTEDVSVSIEPDTSGIANAIGGMVESFNDMRQSALEYADQDSGASALRQRMDNIYFDNEESLQNIGITRDDGGSLQINSEQLAYAVESGEAEETLAENSGFAGQMSRLGEVLANEPADFERSINLTTL